MVSDQEKFRSDNNSNYIDNDKSDINGSNTNYDNIEITRTSMSSLSSPSPTSTTLKSTMSDHDIETLKKLSTYCRSTTPINSTITQISTTNTSTSGCNLGYTSSTTLKRPSRAYRIIDSNASQKILQQLVADKLAAAQTSGKGAKFLKRKGSSRGSQRQLPNFGSQIWNRTEELPLISKAPIFRTNFDVIRTSSFSGNQTSIISKHLDCNRNSLPISVNNNQETEISRSAQKTTDTASAHLVSTRPKSTSSAVEKMTIALDNPRRCCQQTSSISDNDITSTTTTTTTTTATTTTTTATAITADHQHYRNGAISVSADDDPEGVQRLSFVSTSTGYSSARSSLRSSEISDDTVNPPNTSTGKKLLTQESSLSEARRLKLLNNGAVTQLDRIAMELLETERSYVNDLNDIIQGYLNFLVDHREEFEMTVDDISNTFGCIERIFLFNKKLYHDLDAAQLSVVSMAKCLSDNIDGFNDYVMYCTKYQIMIETLSMLLKNKRVAETLRLRQTILGHPLPLSAYLLKPVQRVLKYRLFLENILKASVDSKTLSDGDQAVILQALHSMTSQAEKINEEKKRVEHLERVRELQNALQKWCIDEKEDLSKYGDLLLEATFKLAGAKTNRQLFLFEEVLLIVKERSGALICKDYITCSSLMLNESISTDPLAFQVLSYDNPKIQYIFLASNMDQKRNWMRELKRMMLDHYAIQIPEKTKILMLSLSDDCSKSVGFSGLTSNVKSNKKVPKYLEKRRKSIDVNQTFRRSHVRKQSCSGSRNILKASSTGNLTQEIEMYQEADVPSKTTSHFCNNSKPTTSTSMENTCELESAELSGRLVAFQNLFLKKKNSEASRKKSSCERKSSLVSHLPSSILKDYRTKKSSDSVPNTHDKQHSRCECMMRSPTVPVYPTSQPICPHPSASCCAQKHFDDTMAILYGELQLLMKNAENLNSIGESNRNGADRRNIGSINEVISRTDVPASESRGTDELPEELKTHSRLLSKSDEESLFSEKYAMVDNLKTDCPRFTTDFSRNLINRTFETGCNVSYDSILESEDCDEPTSVVSWIESPHISDKFRGSGSYHNIHHRRRSSQVAEQVWRLRHKQTQEHKDNENNSEKKLLVPSVTRKELLPKDTVTRTLKQSQSTILDHNVDGIDHRCCVARQRTPLTVEQCAELDSELDSNFGAVRKMIKELEKPRALITSSLHQHVI